MFDKLVADLLTTYLGEYFDNIDREQVKVSIWNGRVHLKNLKVRQDALRFFDVPICVLMGTIEELTVVIPWTHLRSESVVVQIRGAKLILSDKMSAAYSIEQEKREERARKDRELHAADVALLAAFKETQQAQQRAATTATASDAASDSSDNNFTARLKATILNNIRVEVQQLFVHYTSCIVRSDESSAHQKDADAAALSAVDTHDAASPTVSLPAAAAASKTSARQASVSFQIKEMKTCGCNERFEPAFVAPGERMSRQLISFGGLAASLRTGPGKETELPLLQPFDVSIELSYQPVVLDTSTPQYMLAVHMDGSCACVMTSEGCTTCYELLRVLQRVQDRQRLRRFRPIGERPITKPQLWWRYVLDAVRQQVQRNKCASLTSAHKPTPFSWLNYTATKAKRDRYMTLYLRRQRVALDAAGWLEPITVDEEVEVLDLEEELSVEMLKLAKRLAMERCAVERKEYEKLVQQKRATAAATATAAAAAAAAAGSPLAKPSANAKASAAATQGGGWFSFWRSTPQQAGGSANVDDNDATLDDETRAELRKLVQLMTAERWTDAQRAVIAQEFGMSADEARELSQTRHDDAGAAHVASPTASSPSSSQHIRSAPGWVIFVRAAAVSLELQSCEADAASHAAAAAVTPRSTLAKVLLGTLQGGAEWGSSSSSSSAGTAASDSSLPVAYYWGTVDLFTITAAKLNRSKTSAGTDQEILSVRRTATAPAQDAARRVTAVSSASPGSQRRQRKFSPLEACWSIVPDECRRSAAWQLEWTQRSAQQLTSRVSAVHRVSLRLAPLHLLVDVVPLRHLTDFFFTVLWPTASAAPAISAAPSAESQKDAANNFFTALGLSTLRPLTAIEQRCAGDEAARLVILRRKVERQHSVEWDVLMECVTVLLAEIPNVQGCELKLEKLALRNDIVHRLQRQERLQTSDADGASVLGSTETDWFDYTHVEAAATTLSVFLPTTQTTGTAKTPSDAATPVARRCILADTPFAIVVERSLLGRCFAEKPPYRLRISSQSAVQLTWSRSTLSVLATSCSTLADLAASIGETLVHRSGAVGSGSGAAPSVSGTPGDEAVQTSSTSTFHVVALPHLTRHRYWPVRGDEDDEGHLDGISSPEVYDKQMHPFSASRIGVTTGSTAAAARRVDVRRGVCVLYHPERLTSPAEYYTLQDGCTRIRRTETTSDNGNVSAVVHLYVLQGGADQDEVMTAPYKEAKQTLLETVRVPPALLGNAVWLQSAVHAWLAKRQHDSPSAADSPSDAEVLAALELVLKGTHLVPCRYVALQCASAEEARTLEAALQRACVAASAAPPLALTSAVQAEYIARVAAPELRQQATLSVHLHFPSLWMTCEGQEPAACNGALPDAQQTGEEPKPQQDSVLSFTPFVLHYDRFPEKQRFELTVAIKTEMYAVDSQNAGLKLPLLKVAPRTPSTSDDAQPALFMRFLLYHRPQPLPSMKRCVFHIHPTATAKVRLGPAMFTWAEAWWDSLGLVTNRLFAEEVVVGHPWWAASSLSADELLQQAQRAQAAWCSERDVGGNTATTSLNIFAQSVEIEVASPTAAAAISVPLSQQESTMLRFAATATELQWRLTEALNAVKVTLSKPALQWRRTSLPDADVGKGWMDVMRCADGTSKLPARLQVNWKLHKSPPMLSVSDWLCGGAANSGAAARVAAATTGYISAAAAAPTGFRDHQELEMTMNDVLLFYWHPLLMHMIQRMQEDVLRRATTVVGREPCWFHDGVLYSPPLTWPHRSAPPSQEISWDRMRKSVTLSRVVLQLPADPKWASSTCSAPPECASAISVASLVYTDALETQTVAATPAEASCAVQEAARQVHTLQFREMVIARRDGSTTLSSAFTVALPDWTFTMSMPVFQANSVWTDKEEWRKFFHVTFNAPSTSQNTADDKGGEVAVPAATTWRGTTADLAFVMNLMHANYVDGAAPSSQANTQQHEAVDVSPASLLKPVTEVSTWTLGVATTFQLDLQPADSQNAAATMSCLFEIAGANASVERSKAGELSCTLDSSRFILSSRNGSAAHARSSGSTVPLISVLADAPAHSVGPAVRLQYGWRWINNAAPSAPQREGVGSGSEKAEGRAMYASVESAQSLLFTADAAAFAGLRALFEISALQEAMRRYTAPVATSASTGAEVATGAPGWCKVALKLRCSQLECQIPCYGLPSSAESSTPSHLRLCVMGCDVAMRFRRNGDESRGALHVRRLLHCVLRDSPTLSVPLLLEQPAGWTQPVTSSPHLSWRTHPSPVRASPQAMDVPKPAQQNMLDELFGELPSPVSTTAPPAAAHAVDANCSPSPGSSQLASPSSDVHAAGDAQAWLAVEFTQSPGRSTFATTVAAMWLLTPSMAHMSRMLAGLRWQLRSIVSVLLPPSNASSPTLTPQTNGSAPLTPRSYAVKVHVGAVSLFVAQKETTVPQPSCTARQVENAARQSLSGDTLLLATEAVDVQWDSDAPSSSAAAEDGCQTVLLLRNTSICAMRGLDQHTILLERFGIGVTRQRKRSGGGSEEAEEEEWKLMLDPVQLTLTQFHYAALLRVALQQTSLLTTLMASATTASQTLAGAALTDTTEEFLSFEETSTVARASSGPLRSFRLQLSSLSFRVQDEDEGVEVAGAAPGSATAVYVHLELLDVTYYSGNGLLLKSGSIASQEALRFAMQLHSCRIGTEGAIPTLSLAPPSSSQAATSDASACVVRMKEDATTKSRSGFAQVQQVTVTVEAVPVMAWVDLLYAPYLQVVVPNYQTAQELVVQRDLWLSDDLVLTERTPMRVVNKSYSLLYLYGNGHTLYLNAGRQGQLIRLDEGVTLRIMHAVVCMDAASIEAYVSGGNGSYVVIDRETCTVMPPSDLAAQVQQQQQEEQRAVSPASMWTDFEGNVQIQLRVPEPRSGDVAAGPRVGGAQRTLVVYSDMQLSLVNARTALPHVNEVSGTFVLAHAGVRSEFVTAHGTSVDASDIVSDWAMTVNYTEEKSSVDGDAAAGGPLSSTSASRRRLQQLRSITVAASRGVEMQVRYSDVFFVLRSARHAEVAFSKWKGALRRDLWSGLAALPQSWDVEEIESSLVAQSIQRERNSAATTTLSNRAASGVMAATDVVTKTSFSLQVPYVSFFAVDDSQNADTPLFCLYVNDMSTPRCVVEPPHVMSELQLTLQLEYYDLAKSQWAPVVDPLKVNLALNWRQNATVADVYNRQGFVRLAVQTSSLRCYFSLELLRNLRQMQVLRAKFDAAGLDVFKVTTASDDDAPAKPGSPRPASSPPHASSSPSSFCAMKLLQTTGLEVEAWLPECVADPSHDTSAPLTTTTATNSRDASAPSRVLASGESWAFNLPRAHGKELPRAQQKILLQQHAAANSSNAAHCGAVVYVASVGVQRVPLSTSGPLQRYVIADVSVPPQQQGQKQIHLHSTVLFRNQLSASLLQLALNERGTYDAVGVVPPGASVYVPVNVLRRRIHLALSRSPADTQAEQQQPSASYALSPDSVVRLGVSYDGLPCLVNKLFLCVSDTVSDADVARGDGGTKSARPAAPANRASRHLARGKLFDIYSGSVSKSYFFLGVSQADSQPADVRHYPQLAPLRAVTVTVSAAVTIVNAVGVPLTVTLLTRRVRPGTRVGLLDTSPDTTVYTTVNTTVIAANGRYGAAEMDLLDDVCVSVALQQPNGTVLQQWSSEPTSSTGTTTAFYPPACIYRPGQERGRDKQLVLVDLATRATLVLYIKYAGGVVTLYCPQWVVNETHTPLQLADTSSPHAGNNERSANAIAGLGGSTVRTATVMPSKDAAESSQGAPQAPPFLYHSLRAEACSNNRSNAGDNGLYVRVWEAADPARADSQAGFSDWSTQPLAVHEASDAQVVWCASRRSPNTVVVLSCRVELGSQTSLHAYSNTRVVYIRPRWVLVNKSPYTLYFSQTSTPTQTGLRRDGDGRRPWLTAPPFSETIVPSVLQRMGGGGGAAGSSARRIEPLVCFALADDAEHNIQQSRLSSSVSISDVHEEATNLLYHSLIPLAEYWPQSSSSVSGGRAAAQSIPDSLPPLQPDDIKEVGGDLYVDREETKVFTTTAYTYKGCMMCVEVEEAAQPPIVIENRTSYTVCFQQRGGPRVSTVFPRCRKAWTWDVAPNSSRTPAVVELWLAREQETSQGSPHGGGHRRGGASPSPASSRATCVLNFDPQQIGQQSRNSSAFQQEIEIEDAARGTSSLLFVRVRGVHGMSYAVSITTEPTIDAYRTLPYPQLSFAMQMDSIFALLRGESAQDTLLCSVRPLFFTFAQGVRRRRDGANASQSSAAEAESADTDVQRMQLRFNSFQVDDERANAKERVVAQLIDDRESGFQLERKLLRTTPILYYSLVALRLTPLELHVEDGFITAMMNYNEVVRGTWSAASYAQHAAGARAAHNANAAAAALPPWEHELDHALALARQSHAGIATGGHATAAPRRSAVPLSSRVVAIDHLYVDPLLVSLSLYRSPGAADDPLWKLAGAASLLVGSTQDARLQWDPVEQRRVCDTIWHLFFVHRNAYNEQLKNQYMSLVNVMGLGTMRNFVSDLLNAYSDAPQGRRDGRGGGGAAAVRRQKPRVPQRSAAKLCVDQPAGRRAESSLRRLRSAPTSTAGDDEDDGGADAEAAKATTRWLQQVADRQVVVKERFSRTVAEVARLGLLDEFLSVARPDELRAFGAWALSRSMMEMPSTAKLAAAFMSNEFRTISTQQVVKTRAEAPRVQCHRCVELELLRAQRVREGASTPLPHPVREGFLTWDEFAHHINWFEFVDMCTDEEVARYASLVCAGSSEASSNVCIITPN